MNRVQAGPVLAAMEDVPAAVILRPGYIHFAKEPTVVTTVLGSCVAATMHCARFRTGAICHALFPAGIPAAEDETFRYVDRSIEAMAAWFGRLGARRGEIEVKLFGGAGTRWSGEGGPASVNVGRSNVESALRTLASHGLRVAARDVGGTIGRKLYFVSHTGDVYLKRLQDGPESADAASGRGSEREEAP